MSSVHRLLPSRSLSGLLWLIVVAQLGAPAFAATTATDDEQAKDKDTAKVEKEAPANLVRILVIDGQPRTKFFVDETSYLMAFFDVIKEKDDVRHRYKVVRLLDLQLNEAAAKLIDVVILCNVESVSAANAKLLDTIVRRGGGLIVFLGNKIDPENYNERLFQAGKGILPAKLKDHIFLKSAKPKFVKGGLAALPYPTRSLPDFKRIYDVAPIAKSPTKNISTIATIDGQKPLLLVKKTGKGNCVLFTSTVDLAWNQLATHPLFVVAMLESLRYARGLTKDN